MCAWKSPICFDEKEIERGSCGLWPCGFELKQVWVCDLENEF